MRIGFLRDVICRTLYCTVLPPVRYAQAIDCALNSLINPHAKEGCSPVDIQRSRPL